MSEADLNHLMVAHRASGIFIDTNLLLLYLIGMLDSRLIARFRRTQAFTPDEYEWLAQFIRQFKRVITTRTVLAEVNSLANQLPEWTKPQFYAVFSQQIVLLDERYVPSRRICTHEHFAKCRLTDAAIMSIPQKRLLVLTADAQLATFLDSLRVDNINFNHLRSYLFDA